MRGLIWLLVVLMLLIIGNIIAYSASEEYRFFLKKLKYPEELVYEDTGLIDDSERLLGWDSSSWWSQRAVDVEPSSTEWMTFLDALSGKQIIRKDEKALPDTTASEEYFLSLFSTFNPGKLETYSNVFGVTTEYPDPFHEWYSAGVSIYAFSTKSYDEVRNIFQAISFDASFELNEVDNFWERSLYINLDEAISDNHVRIVLEYENRAFWLKIRKDRYNEVKEILNALRS